MSRVPPLATAGRRLAEGALLATPLVAMLFLAPTSGFGPEAERALALRALAAIALAALGAAAITERGSGPDAGRRPALETWLAAALVAVGAAAAALAPEPVRSFAGDLPRLDGWLALAANLGLFAAARAVAADSERRRRLALALAAAGGIAAAYALLQVAGIDPLEWGRAWPGRPLGAQGNPVFLAAALLLLLPFGVAEAARQAEQGRRRTAALLALPALAAATALVAARGRGALIGLGAAVVLFVAAMLAASRRRRAAVWLLATAGALAVATLLLPALAGRALPGLDPSAGTARQRVLLWRSTVDLLSANPARLPLGWGPESLALVLPRHLPEELPALVWEAGRSQDRAHNALLDTVAALGLIGLALSMGLAALGVARPLARAGLFSGEGPPGGDRWLDAACAAALAGHLVEIEFGFRTAASGALAALVLGLATARRDGGRGAASAAPLPTALAGTFGGIALALAAQPFAAAPEPGPGTLGVLGATALLAAFALGAGRRGRDLAGRAAPLALALLGAAWLVTEQARGRVAANEALTAAALLPVLLGPVALALALPRPEPARLAARSGAAASLAALALAAALAVALFLGVARPLAGGMAYSLGRAELERGEPDLAAAAFAVAAARAPALVDPVKLEARAVARLAAGTRATEPREKRYERALALLDEARRRHPVDPDLDTEAGLILGRWAGSADDDGRRAERLARARALLESVAERTPASATAWRNLAAVRLDQGDAPGAVAAAERSLRLAPRSLESALLLGRARGSAGDLAGAVEAFGTARDLDAGRAGQILGAIARADPDSFGVQRDLALFSAAAGRGEEAAAALAQARFLAEPAEVARLEAAVAAAARARAGRVE